jgi:hypothetical protein
MFGEDHLQNILKVLMKKKIYLIFYIYNNCMYKNIKKWEYIFVLYVRLN